LIVYTKTNLMKFMNNLSATARRLLPLARIEITFNLLRTNWFVSSRKISIKYFVTWFHRICTFVASKPLRVNLNPSKTKLRRCSKRAFFFDLVQNICAVRLWVSRAKMLNWKKSSAGSCFAQRLSARLPYSNRLGRHHVCITGKGDPALRLLTNRGRENHLFVYLVLERQIIVRSGTDNSVEPRAWRAPRTLS